TRAGGTLSLRFRTATLSDVRSIVALVESAYRGDASRAGWTTEADLLGGQRTDDADVASLMASPRSRILLAESDHLLGSVLLTTEDEDAYIGMLAVRPRLQG